MKYIYRASTQCDACLKVVDTVAPDWGKNQPGMTAINGLPYGWLELTIKRTDGWYGPVCVCDTCKMLSFAEVSTVLQLPMSVPRDVGPIAPPVEKIGDASTDNA